MSKKLRHNAIIKLINEQVIETQGQLTQKLIEMGYDVTQATVSRDIKELRLVKIADYADRYRYATPGHKDEADVRSRYIGVLKHGAVSLRVAMNLVVVKTIAGSAQGCAMAIETLGFEDIIGVIAGDDTLFIALASEDEAKSLVEKLEEVIG